MFRAFGHNNSSILNGGLPRWIAEGLDIEEGSNQGEVTPTQYPAPKLDELAIRSMFSDCQVLRSI
jgi:thiosulfate/3-mercaptopyruvate sulfurtransferase